MPAASAVQLAAIAAVTVGCALIAVPAGFVVGGLLLLLFGVAMERG